MLPLIIAVTDGRPNAMQLRIAPLDSPSKVAYSNVSSDFSDDQSF
jgi:hypothetical protein